MYNNYGLTVEPKEASFLGAATGVAIILIVLLAIIALAIAVITVVAQCKTFSKAGEKWWKGLIPVYSNWVLTKITGLAWWWFIIITGLSAFVTNINVATSADSANYIISMCIILTSFNYHYNLSKKFGKSNGFAVLITLLPFIGYPILAFSSAKYNNNAEVNKNGIFEV